MTTLSEKARALIQAREIKKFGISTISRDGECWDEMRQNESGDYVKASDFEHLKNHAADIANGYLELLEQNEALRRMLLAAMENAYEYDDGCLCGIDLPKEYDNSGSWIRTHKESCWYSQAEKAIAESEHSIKSNN